VRLWARWKAQPADAAAQQAFMRAAKASIAAREGRKAQLPQARAALKGDNAERSLRAYRIYLAGCAMGFENGWIGVHQVLMQHKPVRGRSDELDHPDDLSYPWRRDYMYPPPATPPAQ